MVRYLTEPKRLKKRSRPMWVDYALATAIVFVMIFIITAGALKLGIVIDRYTGKAESLPAIKTDASVTVDEFGMPVAGEAAFVANKAISPEEASGYELIKEFNQPYEGFEIGDEFLFEELQEAYATGLWNGDFSLASEEFTFGVHNVDSDQAQLYREQYAGVYASVKEDGTLVINNTPMYNINFKQAYILSSIGEGKYYATKQGIFSIQGGSIRLDCLPADFGNLETQGTCRWEMALPEGYEDVYIYKADTSDGINVIIEDFRGNGSEYYQGAPYEGWQPLKLEQLTAELYAHAARHAMLAMR